MTDLQMEKMPIFRKADRAANLYELLCETLNLEPLSPQTNWQTVVKAYHQAMMDATAAQKEIDDEKSNN